MIFNQYRGLQITFPTSFFSKDYIKDRIYTEYNGKNIRELARTYGYSERWIREIISKK